CLEKAPWIGAWRRLALVFDDGRKIGILKYPRWHASADRVVQAAVSFLAVPLRDFEEGDYLSALGLRVQDGQMAARAPNTALGNWLASLTFIALTLGHYIYVVPRFRDFDLANPTVCLIFAYVALGVYMLA